jgi:hypothetical protein
VERTLGLICGAGPLPARVAREARQRGHRVVALAFGEAPGLDGQVDRAVRCSIADVAAALDALRTEGVSAVLFCGKFWTRDLLRVGGDAEREAIVARGGGGLSEGELMRGVLATFAALDIEVLDQRPFLGDWLTTPGILSARAPTVDERLDIDRGLRVARRLADTGAGQTVVVRRGMVAAVEASEGTTETVRRGLHLAGPGAVVVKAVRPDNDYRLDVPSLGPETLEAMAAGRAGALAFQTGRVLVIDRARSIALADQAAIAVVALPDSEGSEGS